MDILSLIGFKISKDNLEPIKDTLQQSKDILEPIKDILETNTDIVVPINYKEYIEAN